MTRASSLGLFRSAAALLLSALAFNGIATICRAGLVNFDDVSVPAGGLALISSTHYADVQIQTVENVTDGLIVGDVFTANIQRDNFLIRNNAGAAPSPPNYAFANELESGVLVNGSREVLFSFPTAMSSFSLVTDLVFESPDLVRLMALESLGGGQYRILAVTSAMDDATTIAAATMSVGVPGGFSYALFETTTEREGFDNLQFDPVPEPSSFVMAACAFCLAGLIRLRTGRANGV